LHTDMFPEEEQDLIQINRLSIGYLVPDPAAQFLANFSEEGHFCANFGYCNPDMVATLKEAFAAPRDDPMYCEKLQEAEDMLWNDFTFIGIFTNSLEVPARIVSWVNNLLATIDQDWYTAEQIWIAKH